MTLAIRYSSAALALGMLFVPLVTANGETTISNITINAIGDNQSATFQTGISGDAEITGITVINGEVWIDGQKVPRGTTKFTGKSGKKYRIEWTDGGVQVRDE